jgi:hypothetical protein
VPWPLRAQQRATAIIAPLLLRRCCVLRPSTLHEPAACRFGARASAAEKSVRLRLLASRAARRWVAGSGRNCLQSSNQQRPPFIDAQPTRATKNAIVTTPASEARAPDPPP